VPSTSRRVALARQPLIQRHPAAGSGHRCRTFTVTSERVVLPNAHDAAHDAVLPDDACWRHRVMSQEALTAAPAPRPRELCEGSHRKPDHAAIHGFRIGAAGGTASR
jgi:hypothetical protein